MIVGAWMWGPGAPEARAYVDPGTSGALFSCLPVVLGIVSAGIAVCFGRAKRTVHWFREKLNRDSESTQMSETGDNA